MHCPRFKLKAQDPKHMASPASIAVVAADLIER
jgi:hypothetical protein